MNNIPYLVLTLLALVGVFLSTISGNFIASLSLLGLILALDMVTDYNH